MAQTESVRCPNCGAVMNHHADKVDYNAALQEPEARDAELGGVLERAYTCPSCGMMQVRRSRHED